MVKHSGREGDGLIMGQQAGGNREERKRTRKGGVIFPRTMNDFSHSMFNNMHAPPRFPPLPNNRPLKNLFYIPNL